MSLREKVLSHKTLSKTLTGILMIFGMEVIFYAGECSRIQRMGRFTSQQDMIMQSQLYLEETNGMAERIIKYPLRLANKDYRRENKVPME